MNNTDPTETSQNDESFQTQLDNLKVELEQLQELALVSKKQRNAIKSDLRKMLLFCCVIFIGVVAEFASTLSDKNLSPFDPDRLANKLDWFATGCFTLACSILLSPPDFSLTKILESLFKK